MVLQLIMIEAVNTVIYLAKLFLNISCVFNIEIGFLHSQFQIINKFLNKNKNLIQKWLYILFVFIYTTFATNNYINNHSYRYKAKQLRMQLY